MNIIKILELYNDNKIKEGDKFKSTDKRYYDLVYCHSQICYLDENEDIILLTFSDIADLMNDNVIFIREEQKYEQ